MSFYIGKYCVCWYHTRCFSYICIENTVDSIYVDSIKGGISWEISCYYNCGENGLAELYHKTYGNKIVFASRIEAISHINNFFNKINKLKLFI